jgi:glycosyltransferase involved in cell wall biosynthesis
MRVLHVAAGNLYGGVERILEEIARHAPAASRHEFALSFEGRLSGALDAAAATRHDLGAVRFSRPLSVWRARRRLRRLVRANEYDAVVCHAPWAYALAAPAVAPSLTVLWAHDASRGDHWTERRAARRHPDLVICNSHYTAQAIGSWLNGVPREVVYAPVSPPQGNGAVRSDVRRELGASDDETVVLVASRLERWKGHAELLRSAAALHGLWKIWVAGAPQRPHEATYERELRALADSLRIGERVTFLGDRRDVRRLFRAADVHCQPNITPEPFGIAFIEALYASVPVVTSDLGGAREIVTPECGALVTPGDRQALTRTLQSLIDDPARRTVLGSAGPARARALCDPSTQIAALERVLA